MTTFRMSNIKIDAHKLMKYHYERVPKVKLSKDIYLKYVNNLYINGGGESHILSYCLEKILNYDKTCDDSDITNNEKSIIMYKYLLHINKRRKDMIVNYYELLNIILNEKITIYLIKFDLYQIYFE